MPTDPDMPIGARFMSLINRIQYQEASRTNDGDVAWQAPALPLKMRIFKKELNRDLADQYPAAYFKFAEGDVFIVPLLKLDVLDNDAYAEFVLEAVTDLYNRHDHVNVCVGGGDSRLDEYLHRMSLDKATDYPRTVN